MVEAIGSLAKLMGRTVQAATPASAVAAIKAPPAGADEARVAATQVARDLSASAPVDHARVARIKQAIASGNYPIAPETIADRLLALKLDWRPGAMTGVGMAPGGNTRRDWLVHVIEALHVEIAALKANDIAGLERATQIKLAGLEALQRLGAGPVDADLRGLAEEADRLNETCRIYVNLMAANVRRRLGDLGGLMPGYGVKGKVAAYA